MSAADLHTLTGAYAAHALDPAESAEFERHLAGCPACVQEVAEFAATLARLGAAQAVLPPPALKAQVMAALPTLRQEAPRTAPAPGRPRDRLARGWAKLALAACLASAVGAGGVAVQQHQQAERARARAAALQQQQDRFVGLLTAPDARTATGTGAGGVGAGTVVWSSSRGQAGFLAAGLPTPAAGTTYELWFDDAGTMRPAGLLPTGDGVLLLTGTPDGAGGVGVTVEPAGGSAHPTTAPLMLLPFT
ncbi:anti-sigma factor domain-containing protein [Kitasatospora sp. NPDC089509]|uniref:anti-sigma factor n=1 Tax=Kitasatospora sp. NPDC089509 TaxID=3364079 RepID=UPI00381FC930